MNKYIPSPINHSLHRLQGFANAQSRLARKHQEGIYVTLQRRERQRRALESRTTYTIPQHKNPIAQIQAELRSSHYRYERFDSQQDYKKTKPPRYGFWHNALEFVLDRLDELFDS